MPTLNPTESRLPHVFPDNAYFNAKNANILGKNHFDGNYCLVSYLPVSVRTIASYGNFQNRYVVFIDTTGGLPTSYSCAWSVNYEFENNPTQAAPTPSVATTNFYLDVAKTGLSDALIADLKFITVECAVTHNSVTTNLKIKHNIGTDYPDILLLKADNGSDSIAKAGNPPTTDLLVNIFRESFPVNPRWYGVTGTPSGAAPDIDIEFGHTTSENEPNLPPFPPTNLPTLTTPMAITYSRVMKSGKNQYFPEFNSSYYTKLNDGSLVLEKNDLKNVVGMSAIRLHFAGFALGYYPFQRIDGTFTEQSAFNLFNGLTIEQKVDAYNYARFPRSGFLLATLMIKQLQDEAVTNLHAHYRGDPGDKTNWTANVANYVQDDDYIKNLVFEYVNGPQHDIGGGEFLLGSLRLRKAFSRIHKHDWSSYVKAILSREFAQIGEVKKIKKARFCQKTVTIDAEGVKTVLFAPIVGTADLGREVFLVVETENLDNAFLDIKIKTADTNLTNTTAGDDLVLAPNVGTNDTYTVEVGDDSLLKDEAGTLYNVEPNVPVDPNYIDLSHAAIVKIGLRPETVGVFNTWNGYLNTNGDAVLNVEVVMSSPSEFLMLYGNDVTPIAATNSKLFTNALTVGAVVKTTVPRINRAYFAKKVVDAAVNPPNVSFEPILDPTDPVNVANANARKWAIGSEVFVIIETENLQGQNIECFVQAGDEFLTGTKGEILPLVANKVKVMSGLPVTAAGANTAMLNNAAGAVGYSAASLNALVDKVIFKLDLRPTITTADIAGYGAMVPDQQTAEVLRAKRLAFYEWSRRINRNPTAITIAAPTVAPWDLPDPANIAPDVADNAADYAGIELFVRPANPATYCYYGPRPYPNPFVIPYEEEAVNYGKIFLSENNNKFIVRNRSFYDIFHVDNVFNSNSNINDIGGTNVHAPIRKLVNPETHKVEYNYRDENDNLHFVCDTDRVIPRPQQKANGTNTVPNTIAQPYRDAVDLREDVENGVKQANALSAADLILYNLVLDTIDYTAFNADGVNAQMSYIFADGVVTRGNHTNPRKWYADEPGNIDLVNAHIITNNIANTAVGYNGANPDHHFHETGLKPNHNGFPALNYISGDIRIIYCHYETMRRFANPDLFAGWLGSLGHTRFTGNITEGVGGPYTGVFSEGFSYSDGTCYPSNTHANGEAVDTLYLSNLATQNLLVNAMRGMGFRSQGRYANTLPANWKQNIAHSYPLNFHDTHLHSVDHEPRFVVSIL